MKRENIKYTSYTYLLFIIHLNTRVVSTASFAVITTVWQTIPLSRMWRCVAWLSFPTFRMNGSPSSSMTSGVNEIFRPLLNVTQRRPVIEVQTFRDNLSFPYWPLEMEPKDCPKTSGTNYQYKLRHISGGRNSNCTSWHQYRAFFIHIIRPTTAQN